MDINEISRRDGFSKITKRVINYNNFVNENCRILNKEIAENIKLLQMVRTEFLLPAIERFKICEDEESEKELKNVKNIISIVNEQIESCQVAARSNNEVAIAENNTLNNFANKVANAELEDTIEEELIESKMIEEEKAKNDSVITISAEMNEQDIIDDL